MKREEILKYHINGKIGIELTKPVKTRKQLSLSYTPGVAEVCRTIQKDKKKVWEYTIKNHMIAIVTDGSRVLGLGNIGPEAAMPVMEGKAVLLKKFGNADTIPICLKTQDKEEIIRTIKYLTPAFGGINLEDIESPKCFEIEERLIEEVDIPIFHDDQHGTATAILAGLINAAKVTGKEVEEMKIVVNGAGAAGLSIAKVFACLGLEESICKKVKEVILCDSLGAIYPGRGDLNPYKEKIAQITNPYRRKGRLQEIIKDADVFIGVSAANVLSKEMVKMMAEHAIVFALANPTPEISPSDAKKAGAKVIATGRSDLPNQINNLLAFPGIWKGTLAARAKRITPEMRVAAAYAIAKMVKHPTKAKIVPNPLDPKVHQNVATAVERQAKKYN